ncbi:MAG TPA: amino acid deaminase/aldolase [Micromonosporaceae bacterium]|jgi:D-serine deaminase-like pyridoxal phosphate-dependent protein
MTDLLPASMGQRFDRATASLDPPFAIIDADAFDDNATSLVRLATGRPVRVASKSVRCRELIRDVLRRPGYHGVMAYSLPEANWLVTTGVSDDVLMGYPTADRAGIAELAASERLAAAVTLMIDSEEQLNLVDAVAAPGHRPTLRVCLDLDASWRPMPGAHIGVRRSPLHAPAVIGAFAARVVARPGFRLVGVMSYEAQIAGLGDAPPGRPLYGRMVRMIQSGSYRELLRRRGKAVRAVRQHADLEFVNGGGTGSLRLTAADPSVTEVTAGSGLFGPGLFDEYRAWRPTPAAFFATSVVRRPGPGLVTVHGGGWIASGPAVPSRLPRPVLPPGLRLLATEGAGEVQTPLAGAAAATLHPGDRVWWRHAKAGELCEHVTELHLVRGETIERSVPTYRGEDARTLL